MLTVVCPFIVSALTNYSLPTNGWRDMIVSNVLISGSNLPTEKAPTLNCLEMNHMTHC